MKFALHLAKKAAVGVLGMLGVPFLVALLPFVMFGQWLLEERERFKRSQK